MGRRPIDSNMGRWASTGLFLLGLSACIIAYIVISVGLKPSNSRSDFDAMGVKESDGGKMGKENNGGCCKGIGNLELWGSAVKWGTEHKFDTVEKCCESCKGMCSGNDGPCLCDSWVFCGDREGCGHHFGECWLKKQKDTLAPQQQDAGSKVLWTSGLVFGKGEYILELLPLRHCAGCQFYRAEGRGDSWDLKGNHIDHASFGPPYALIQGTLEASGTNFKKIPTEVCRTVRRGSVAWVGSGPEFFISLANHVEWKGQYTVFGSVLLEDMEIAEEIANLPTKSDVWNNVSVSVLENPIPIFLRRLETNDEDNKL